ncbi:MAG: hypothetical protein ACK4Z8_10920, partial [Novosphingobium sp.]
MRRRTGDPHIIELWHPLGQSCNQPAAPRPGFITRHNLCLAQELLGQIRRARDQLLTFCDFPGKVDATNNVSERALRPS